MTRDLTTQNLTTQNRTAKVLMTTWRRQGRVFGPVLRDMFGVEVSYVHALEAAGATPYLVTQPSVAVAATELLDDFQGLVLIGGEDLAAEVSGADPTTIGDNADAARDRWEIALLEAALAAGVPVLAICRGMQLLNVSFGGTLHGDITGRAEHPVMPDDRDDALGFRHDVTLAAGSRIRGILDRDVVATNSLHHQAVDRLGSGLRVTGTTADGIVEAIEVPDARWCVGIQWHPELMAEEPQQHALVAAFVAACREPADVARRRS